MKLPFLGLVMLAIALPVPAQAADDWLVITIGSRHHKRGYNERNWGIGIERKISDNWRMGAGTYRNSYYRQTLYAGVTYAPLRFGDWHLGGTALLVTGYESRPVVVPFPSISYEQKEWGLNFGPILPTVVGVQLKLKF